MTGRTADCPDAETLAAFVDGRLDASGRSRVEAHIADCEACYETVVETIAIAQPLKAKPAAGGSADRGWSRSRWWLAAAAAVVAVAIWKFPRSADESPDAAMANFVRAIGSQRFATARLSESFEYGPPPVTTRGAPGSAPSHQVEGAALHLRELAENNRTAAALRGAGIAHLATGSVDDAINLLQEAAGLDKGNASIHIDLAAAFLERSRRNGSKDDGARALDELGKGMAGASPPAAALFNRALALESLGSLEGAVRAWEAYLSVDSKTPWASEARSRLDDLRKRIARQPLAQDLLESPDALLDLAKRSPSRLARFAVEEVLEPWARREASADAVPPETARRIGNALRSAGADYYLPDLVETAMSSGPDAAARRACMASAILDMSRSRAAFDASSYVAAGASAERAATSFRCAGFTQVDARVQQAWSQFFKPARASALAVARPLLSEAEQRHYFHVAARIEYMEGLSAAGFSRIGEALDRFSKAFNWNARVGDTDQEAAIETEIAEAQYEQGDVESPWKHHAHALGLLGSESQPRIKYLALSSAVFHEIEERRYRAAASLAEQLDVVVSSWSQPVAVVDSLSLKARLQAALGQASDALRSAHQATALLPRLDEESTRSQYEADIGLSRAEASLARDPQATVQALEPMFARVRTADLSLLLADLSLLRGRAYKALGQMTKAQADWLHGIEVLELQRSGIQEPFRIARTSRLWDLYAELIDATKADPSVALAVAERARSRALLDSVAPGTVVAPVPSELHAWLPPGRIVFVYAVLADSLLRWTVTHDGVQLHEEPVGQSQIDELVERHLQALGQRSAQATGEALGRLLLPSDINGDVSQPVVFLPDGPLHRVPFGTLINPRTGHWLVQDAVPSVDTSLAVMRARPPRESRAVLPSALLIGYGAPQPGLNLSALPGVDDEIASLAVVYARKQVLRGSAATAAAILPALSNHTIVHFAGHALADARQPGLARLLVAPSVADAITPRQIAAAHLRPGTVVVLSTCDGAGGPVYRGEGLMSLARPFLAAGASSVLASLWPANDSATARFMLRVHQGLANGRQLAESLAAVQRTFLQANADPVEWAGWIALGSN